MCAHMCVLNESIHMAKVGLRVYIYVKLKSAILRCILIIYRMIIILLKMCFGMSFRKNLCHMNKK